MDIKTPLQGLKVVDFSWSIAGPVIAKHLADFGATVVHVESHTRPDVTRTIRPFKDGIPHVDRAGIFNVLNTSKLSLSVNLNNKKGRELASRAIKWADVLVESYTPKTMKAWSLDYENVRQIKPEIVYLSTCIFGQAGPRANYRGWGFQAAAIAGANYLTGWPDRFPVLPYGAYSDSTAPPFALSAILAALDHKRRTGRGQYIDQSQFETVLQMFAPVLMDCAMTGRVMIRDGNRNPAAVPHNAYRCKGEDNWCTIAVFNDTQWQGFKKALGDPNWGKDSKFETLHNRKANEAELDALIQEWTISHDAEEVMTIMQQFGVPAGVVRSNKDLFDDPQLKHRDHLHQLKHKVMGYCTYSRLPFRLSHTTDKQSAAPAIGEHNEYVCKEILRMSDDEIAEAIINGALTTDADLKFDTPSV